MPAAKIYYDSDADLAYLKDKTIVFLGFGNQGAAQAQNLRDSGLPNDKILIANRADSYAKDAISKNFNVTDDFGKAAEVADILFLLIPDQVQPRLFNEKIAPSLKQGCTIVIASGYNVFFKFLNIPSTSNVVMVAPRMIGESILNPYTERRKLQFFWTGSSVRSLYQKGQGFPCFVSVEQDGAGKALEIALAISRVIGATKAGAIESSAREETAMDLFAEQALWPNIIMLFQQAFNVLKEAGCSDEALCYEMWMSKEPAEIFERAAEDGFIRQLKHHSTVSQYGQLNGALSLDGSAIRKHFENILHNQVLNGKFAREFSKIEDALEKEGPENPLNELHRRAEETELGQAEMRCNVMAIDASPGHNSVADPSTETHKTRPSHRSRSRSRHRRKDDRRHRSRSHGRSERSHRDRRSRSRDRSHRDRDRGRDRDNRDRDVDKDRERERELRHRDRDRNGHRDRDRDTNRDDMDRRERRRRHVDDDADQKPLKRIREDTIDTPRTPMSVDSPQKDDGRRPRSRDSDRRSIRSGRGARDLRDDYDRRGSPRRDGSARCGPDDRPIPPKEESPLVEDERPMVPRGRSGSQPIVRPSPSYDDGPQDPYLDEPKEDDSEARSVFVSQLAARMTARDLGYFFEDKLGENTVLDSRIVTDRLSRRSKGIAYVEFRSIELVEQAIALSGTIVMGLPIMIQHTEAERNKTHAGDGSINLPPGASGRGATLYVGSLHFNLTESDIKQVFEPFGELDFVDLHRDPATGRSKGYAFVHYKRAEDAKMALEQMEGFELAGRTLRVNTVHEKGQSKIITQDSLDEGGGGNLNAASRQALMQKLARIDSAPTIQQQVVKPAISQPMMSKSVLLKNMFNPEEETEPNWDKELAEDVKGECQAKYGGVQHIKVEKDSEGEIYVQFDGVDSAKKAIESLNGRWFGGRKISATFISDAIMQAHR
ncbi:RSD1 [Sanghuangporus weigelae]